MNTFLIITLLIIILYLFFRLSHKAILEVERYDDSIAAPVFIALPQTQIVIEGDSTTFDCAANGNPKPSITWLKNGEAIDLKLVSLHQISISFGSHI